MDNRLHVEGPNPDGNFLVWLDAVALKDGLILGSGTSRAAALMAATKEAEQLRDQLAASVVDELVSAGKSFTFQVSQHVEVRRS